TDSGLGKRGQLGPFAGRIRPAMHRPWHLGRAPAEQEREGVGADRVLLGHPRQDFNVAVGGCRAGAPPWSLPTSHATTTRRGQGRGGDQGCPAGGPPRSWWGADQ